MAHIPGFIAEKDGEVRYYATQANACEWAGFAPNAVVPAMVPVGAIMHDVFASLEDYFAGKPAAALALYDVNADAEMTFANEDEAYAHAAEYGTCLVDADGNEAFCKHADH